MKESFFGIKWGDAIIEMSGLSGLLVGGALIALIVYLLFRLIASGRLRFPNKSGRVVLNGKSEQLIIETATKVKFIEETMKDYAESIKELTSSAAERKTDGQWQKRHLKRIEKKLDEVLSGEWKK